MTRTLSESVFVRPLAAAGLGDIAAVGTKAVYLGELARAGFPVLPGFCVTVDAYARHVAQAGVAPALDAVHRPLAGYTRTAGAPEPSADLLARLRRRIAVTPLPLPVAEALRAALDALAGPGEPQARADPALVVRVSARGAGCGAGATFLDSADPDTLSDAVRDCWASLWSDSLVAYRAAHEISPIGVACAILVQRRITPSHTGRLLAAGPDASQVTLLPPDGDPDLSPEQIIALKALGARVAEQCGRPMDIEWALTGEEVAILEARPTALAQQPARARRAGTAISRHEDSGAPAGRDVRSSAAAPPGTADAPLAPHPFDEAAILPLLREARATRPRGLGWVALPWRLVRAAAYPLPHWQTRRAWQDNTTRLARAREGDQRIRGGEVTEEALLTRTLDQNLALAGAVARLRGHGPARLRAALAARLTRHLMGVTHVDGAEMVMAAIPSVPSRADARLWELAAGLGPAPAPDVVAAASATYLEEYGFRDTAGLVVGEPPWRDVPTLLPDLLRHMARATRPAPGLDAQEAYRTTLRRLPRPARRLYRWAVRNAQAGHGFRADTAYALSMALGLMRTALLALGSRLAARGILADANDILFLQPGEITLLRADQGAGLTDKIAGRKETWRAARAQQEAPPPDGDRPEWRGRGVAGGQAEGVARPIRSVEEFGRLAPGEILLAPYLTPGWAPLLELAAGAVVERAHLPDPATFHPRTGGAPIIVGVAGALTAIPASTPIRIDGATGSLTPV
jgi:pyruvate,water dikinase